jgi:hypothetical protein
MNCWKKKCTIYAANADGLIITSESNNFLKFLNNWQNGMKT